MPIVAPENSTELINQMIEIGFRIDELQSKRSELRVDSPAPSLRGSFPNIAEAISRPQIPSSPSRFASQSEAARGPRNDNSLVSLSSITLNTARIKEYALEGINQNGLSTLVQNAAIQSQKELVSVHNGEAVRAETPDFTIIFKKDFETSTSQGKVEITASFQVLPKQKQIAPAAGKISVSEKENQIFKGLDADISPVAKAELANVIANVPPTLLPPSRGEGEGGGGLPSIDSTYIPVFTENAFFSEKGNLALVADELAATYGQFLVVTTNRAQLEVIRNINQKLNEKKRLIAVSTFEEAEELIRTKFNKNIGVIGVEEDRIYLEKKNLYFNIWSQETINGLLVNVKSLIIQFQAALHLAYAA